MHRGRSNWKAAGSVALLAGALLGPAAGVVAVGAPAGATAGSPSATSVPVAYVTNSSRSTVSVITGTKLTATIDVGGGPVGIAITPNQTTAYVADLGFEDAQGDTVTPIDLADHTAGKAIKVGVGPIALAVTPNGKQLLVTLNGTSTKEGHQVVAVDLSTGVVSAPINVGENPEALAITPDGDTAYVADLSSAEVTPIDLTTSPPKAEAAIKLPGTSPRAIAIAPDGETAYVLDSENATIIPITLATRKVGTPVDLVCTKDGDPGCTPTAIAISSDGSTAFVAAAGSADVMLVGLPLVTVEGVLDTGGYPDAPGLGGGWLYVCNGESNTESIFTEVGVPKTTSGLDYPFGVVVVAPTAGTAPPLSGVVPVVRTNSHRPAPTGGPTKPFYGPASP